MYIDLVTINLCPGQGGGGVKPSGTLDIVENGVYNVYSYSSASVDVHPSISLSETYISNGSYNITGEFNGGVITVDVPAPQFVTETLNVSANGTYTPGEGVNGYSQVVVDVPQSVTGHTQKEITEGVQIVNLSNTASYVHPYVFEKDSYLQTVNLPNCTSVGENAFAYCSNLTTVNLPECKTIGFSAFYDCESLAEVYLPKCEYIGNSAFYSCKNLSGVLSLPICSYVGYAAFRDCSKISYVYIPSCEYIKEAAFYANRISEANFPLCYEVGAYAFTNCSSLQKASFPNCYTFGGYGLFNNDVSLEELTLNMNNYLDFASYYTSFGLSNTKLASGIGSIYVQSWHYDKYITANGWSSLSERFVSVPVSSMLSFSNGLLSGYTTIIEYSFNSYIGISYSEVINVSLPNFEIVIPKPNHFPPKYVFEDCKNLQTLYLGSMSLCPKNFISFHSNIKTVNFPVCTSIGSSAFYNCISLSDVNLPNVEYVDVNAFFNCNSLSRINLPLCKYIGDRAFQQCSSLSQISLPVCSIIGYNLFDGCSSLSIITIGYSGVCSLNNSNAFNATQITSSTGSIYVPTSLVDSYKSAPNWSYFSTQIFPIE